MANVYPYYVAIPLLIILVIITIVTFIHYHFHKKKTNSEQTSNPKQYLPVVIKE